MGVAVAVRSKRSHAVYAIEVVMSTRRKSMSLCVS